MSNYKYQQATRAYLAYDNMINENKLRAILTLLNK